MAISRRQLLRGDFTGERQPLRPPWALPEQDFLEACSACGDCVGACPERIIVRGRGAYPAIDFSRGECTFCAACRQCCPTLALQSTVAVETALPWRIQAVIKNNCLESQGIHCHVCIDQCPSEAIHGRRSTAYHEVVVDTQRCSGCGACFGPCPVDAIELNPADSTSADPQD